MDSALSVNVRPIIRVLVVLCFFLVARTTNAQSGSELFSFDIGVGPAIGSGRLDWKERAGAGFSVNFSWRPSIVPKRRAIFAVNSAGFFLPFEEQTLCISMVGDDGTFSEPCTIAKAPDAISIGALAGVALGPDASGVRIMAGPALFRAREQDNSVGLQSRVDFARPIRSAVSFVMWAQGMLIPLSTENHTAKVLSGGVGLRLR